MHSSDVSSRFIMLYVTHIETINSFSVKDLNMPYDETFLKDFLEILKRSLQIVPCYWYDSMMMMIQQLAVWTL